MKPRLRPSPLLGKSHGHVIKTRYTRPKSEIDDSELESIVDCSLSFGQLTRAREQMHTYWGWNKPEQDEYINEYLWYHDQ